MGGQFGNWKCNLLQTDDFN